MRTAQIKPWRRAMKEKAEMENKLFQDFIELAIGDSAVEIEAFLSELKADKTNQFSSSKGIMEGVTHFYLNDEVIASKVVDGYLPATYFTTAKIGDYRIYASTAFDAAIKQRIFN